MPARHNFGKAFFARDSSGRIPRGVVGAPNLETELFKLHQRSRAADHFRPSYARVKMAESGKCADSERLGKRTDFVGRYRKSR